MSKLNQFDAFLDSALKNKTSPEQVIARQKEIFNQEILPNLKAKKANPQTIQQAKKEWDHFTTQSMAVRGFIQEPDETEGVRKDRLDTLQASKQGKGALLYSGLKAGLKDTKTAVARSALSTVGSVARWANDIGENEKGSFTDNLANAMKEGSELELANATENYQKGSRGEQVFNNPAANFGYRAGQVGGESLMPMLMPLGAAKGVGIGLKTALNARKVASAGKIAATGAMATGLGAGYTQNYGGVRDASTRNIERDFADPEAMSNVPEYQQKVKALYDAGMDMGQAQEQAYAETIDQLSENKAEDWGKAITAVEFIAPGAATLGAKGIGRAVGQAGVDRLTGLAATRAAVQQAAKRGTQSGIDLSWAGNRASLNMMGRQGLEEGLQGGMENYAGQDASSDIGGRAVDYNEVGKQAALEGAMGAFMGSGIQIASGHTPGKQAQQIADGINQQQAAVTAAYPAAQANLQAALQSGDQTAIEDAQLELQSIQGTANQLGQQLNEYQIAPSPDLQSIFDDIAKASAPQADPQANPSNYPALPAPAMDIAPDGTVRTSAQRSAEVNREQDRIARGDTVLDITPIPRRGQDAYPVATQGQRDVQPFEQSPDYRIRDVTPVDPDAHPALPAPAPNPDYTVAPDGTVRQAPDFVAGNYGSIQPNKGQQPVAQQFDDSSPVSPPAVQSDANPDAAAAADEDFSVTRIKPFVPPASPIAPAPAPINPVPEAAPAPAPKKGLAGIAERAQQRSASQQLDYKQSYFDARLRGDDDTANQILQKAMTERQVPVETLRAWHNEIEPQIAARDQENYAAYAQSIKNNSLNPANPDQELPNIAPAEEVAPPEPSQPVAPVSTAESIRTGMKEISRGMGEGAREQVAEYIREGKTERLTYAKPEAVEAALNNPDYHTQQNPDGSVTVVGVKDSQGDWVGVSPEQQQASTKTPVFSKPAKANEYLRTNGLIDTHEAVANDDGLFEIRQKAEQPDPANVDAAAHQAATSPLNDLPEPTQAQKEAGNYTKGHVRIQGLDITVENPKGSERTGIRPDGSLWSHRMSDHYGYIKKTTGADNEHIDAYIGPNPNSQQVYVVDQIDQPTGQFDEHKVMLGFDSQDAATKAYQSNFDDGWKVGPIRAMSMDEFKSWLKNDDTTKPANGTQPAPEESTMQQGDIGRVSDGQPFANQQAAKLHQTKNGLKESHDVVRLGKAHHYVLRPKVAQQEQAKDNIDATPSSSAPAQSPAEEQETQAAKQDPVKPKTSKKPAIEKPETSDQPQGKIEDFGEKIGGAKKDLWKGYTNSLSDALPELKDITMAKHFPEPDYQALMDAGVSEKTLAAVKAMRDEMPAKPRVTSKLQQWAERLKNLREFTHDLITGKLNIDELQEQFKKSFTLREFSKRVDLYTALGFPAFTQLKGVEIKSGRYTIFKGEKYPNGIEKWTLSPPSKPDSYFDSFDELVEGARAYAEAMINAPAKAKSITLDIYQMRKTGDIVIGKKVASGKYVDLKTGFKTSREAREYLANNKDELLQLLKDKKQVEPERRETNDPRVGEDYRKGEDISPEQFAKTFGFRGVEFGNYVENARRQQDLNNAYDALLDLANLLNIPASAISLNGELGLAFGARGSGGINPAKAHYEGGSVVINLTKNNGAGSLAHEWWHALDNYFSRTRGKPGEFISDRPRVLKTLDDSKRLMDDLSIRPEVLDAWKGVIDAIKNSGMTSRSRELDASRSKDYWSTDIEMTARAFERFVIDSARLDNLSNDYLANIVSEERYKKPESYPYPTNAEAVEIGNAYRNLFDTLKTKTTDKGTALYSRNAQPAQGLNTKQVRQALIDRFGHDTVIKLETAGKLEIIDQLGELPEGALNSIQAFHGSPYKFDQFSLEHLGRGDGHQLYGFGLYFSDSKAVSDFYRKNLAANDDGQLYQVNIDSDGQDILNWEESLESQKTISDRLAPLQEHLKQQGVLDQYETTLGFPFNEWNGGELYTVLKHAAKNKLLPQQSIDVLEAVEMGKPDKAASLYLHSLGINGLKYAQSARDGVIPSGSSNYVIFDDSAIQITNTFFSQNPNGIEGYYHNGKTVLVASNLTADTVIPAFLHEVGGHAGMQGLMKPATYDAIMQQFDSMIAYNNPLAMEAKRRAEVEADPAVQRQEYLPYLISVATEAQAAGNGKGGAYQAIQRFIARIVNAIKAWAVDVLGVPLKLNPDDVVALAERMVQRVAKAPVTPSNVGANRSLNEATHSPFQKAIDDVVAGNTQDRFFNMGSTPDVLKMLGLPDTKITIKGKTIEKVMAQHLGIEKGTHSNIHNLTPDTLRQLPKQINEPVAVFKSGSDATRQGYVVLTELTEKDTNSGKDKPVIVALHLNKTKQGVELINVASIYGKDSLSALQKSLDSDLLYWNKEKGQDFVNAFSLQLPSQIQAQSASQTKGSPSNVGSLRLQPETHSAVSLSTTNIKTNEDLVKYQSVNSPAFKRWFGDSKVVDSDGKPLVMYHGTHKAFNSFNTQDSGALLGKGSYFAADRTGAAPYAQQSKGKIVEAYISIQNPYYAKSVLESIPKRSELAEKGFDGVILLNEDGSVKWAVAHEPSQIKSATKNTGGFDPSNPDIRFSRQSTPPTPQQQQQADTFDKAAQIALQQWQLRSGQFGKTPKRIGKFLNTMLHKALTHPEFKKPFDLIQAKINHVSVEAYDSLRQAPELLGHMETGADYMRELKNLSPANFKARKADFAAVSSVIFDGTLVDKKVFGDKALKSKGLTDKQIQLYHDVRAAIETSLDHYARSTLSKIAQAAGIPNERIMEIHNRDMDIADHHELLRVEIGQATTTKNFDQQADAVERMEAVIDKLEQLKDEGYAPLMRFGNYFVKITNPQMKTAENEDGTVLRQHYEDETERDLAYQELKSKLPAGHTIEKESLKPKQYKMFHGVSPETVALFVKESGLPTDDITQQYLKLATAQQSALRRMIHRKGIAGFSEDIQRVLSAFVMSNARYSANRLYNDQISEAVMAIKDGDLHTEAHDMMEYALDPKEEMQGLKNFMFIYYMGASVMFGLINMTQPIMQTMPHLSRYIGGSAAQTMFRGIKFAGQSLKTNTPPPIYKDVYERAQREGHLDPQNVWMLQGLERGKSGLASSGWQVFSHSMGYIAQATETINRRATLFAATEAARKMGNAKLKGLGFDSDYDFAIRAIQETQGIYNKGNRPMAARGWGSLLMMYKQFGIAYVEQMIRAYKDPMWGGERDEKRKALVLMLSLLFSTAGLTGLPFMRDLLDLAETGTAVAGKPMNLERETQIYLRDQLGKEFGQQVADGLLDGPINLFPYMADIKGRTNMGNMLPGTALFNPTLDTRDKAQQVGDIGGATGNLVIKMYDAMSFLQKGMYDEAVASASPRAFGDIYKGGKGIVTGELRNERGDKTADISLAESLVKIIGGQPSRVADEGRIRGFERRDRQTKTYVSAQFKEQLEEAMGDGDKVREKEIRQAVKDWNKANPRYPVNIRDSDMKKRVKNRNSTWQDRNPIPKGQEWFGDYR